MANTLIPAGNTIRARKCLISSQPTISSITQLGSSELRNVYIVSISITVLLFHLYKHHLGSYRENGHSNGLNSDHYHTHSSRLSISKLSPSLFYHYFNDFCALHLADIILPPFQ